MRLNKAVLTFRIFLALLCVLAPSLLDRWASRGGVLALGVLLFIVVSATHNRFGQQATAILVIAGSGLALAWGWLGPHLGETWAMILARGLFVVWIAYCLTTTDHKSWRAPPTAALVVLGLAVVIAFIDRDQVWFFLSYGYDNSANVPALAHTLRHQGFVYSGSLPDNFTFGNYVNGYPPLQASTWALAMSAAGIRLRGGYEILHYFAYFNFIFGFLLSGLIIQIWAGKPGTPSWNHVNAPSRVLCWILVACSQVSFIFWMGFSSLVFGCVIVLASLAWCQTVGNEVAKFLTVLLGLTILNYSYPLLSPALALAAIGLLVSTRILLLEAMRLNRAAALTLISVVVTANYPVVKKTLALSSYVDDAGGIQPISMWFLCLVLLLCLAAIASSPLRRTVDLSLVLALVGSLIAFSCLAALSRLQRDYVSYYPQKSGYLALLMGLAVLGRLEVLQKCIFGSTFKGFLRIFPPVTISILIVSTFSTRTMSGLQFGFPSTLSVVSDVWSGTRDASVSCFQEAMRATEDIQYINDSEVILFGGDFTTRWINAARGRLSDATYSLAIPLNNPDIEITTHISEWLSQYPTTSLIILHESGSDLKRISNSRVILRELECLT